MTATGGCWPTRQQELLLHASLDRGPSALDAWNAWRGAATEIDPGSRRLLPLTYHNLRPFADRCPSRARLRSEYQHAWAKNQAILRELRRAVDELRRYDIDVILLKGAALSQTYYDTIGLRPMEDADVLVRPEQAPRAFAVLWDLGWAPQAETPEPGSPLAHALTLRNPANVALDLHWYVLWESRRAQLDVAIWSRARPSPRAQALVLAPTDQLFHICIHGVRWNVVPPLRWVADAVTLLRAARDQIDWDSLVASAVERRLVLPVRDALAYLARAGQVAIPVEVVRRLRAIDVPLLERLEYRATLRPQPDWDVGRMLLRHWCIFNRCAEPDSRRRQITDFGDYLQQHYGARSLRSIPARALARGYARLSRAADTL